MLLSFAMMENSIGAMGMNGRAGPVPTQLTFLLTLIYHLGWPGALIVNDALDLLGPPR